MTLINVAFSDATEATITAVFALPQSKESFPFQGQVDSATSSAWATFYADLSPAAQAAWPAPPAASATT
jgi:hypothetical protein